MTTNAIAKSKGRGLAMMGLLLLSAGNCIAAVADIQGLIERGWFRQAYLQISEARVDSDTASARELLFEAERMRRIDLDFPYREPEIRAQLQKQLPDVSDAEFTEWRADDSLQSMIIDGERRYFHRAVKNLFYIRPELLARKNPKLILPADGLLYQSHPLHRKWLEGVPAGSSVALDPVTLRIRHSLTVEADAVPAGEIVRAWIPFPRVIEDRQQSVRLLASSPGRAVLAPDSAEQRTAYLEHKAVAGTPTEFNIEYELVTHTIATRINPASAKRDTDPALQPYLAEQPPHIMFTPALRAFSSAVLGSETNPYLIAQRLFQAVAAKPWAVAREYSTIYNISDHALASAHADCGEKTMLLIALMRLNGIPARWQSGWQFSPEGSFDTMHDWGMFHLAPYGWLPMDPTHGVLGDADPAVQWFYLGGIDAYRVAFNDDWGRAFTPAKQHPRSEPVDSQRGEVEWRGGNLYFDQWDYSVQWRQIKGK